MDPYIAEEVYHLTIFTIAFPKHKTYLFQMILLFSVELGHISGRRIYRKIRLVGKFTPGVETASMEFDKRHPTH